MRLALALGTALPLVTVKSLETLGLALALARCGPSSGHTPIPVPRDMYVDRRRGAGGIRIRGGTARATARDREKVEIKKNPAGRLERTGYYF